MLEMFRKRETILENISLMALMAAINVIAGIIASFFPIAAIFIVILMPFFSAAIALNCKWKYYPIYVLATIAVALISLSWNMGYTVFYIIPSLITGFLFGLCFTYKLNGIYSLLATSIIMCAIKFLSILLINFIYDIDLVNQFLALFNLSSNELAKLMVLPFAFLISFVQMVFSYIVLYNELTKFDYIVENENSKLLSYIGLGSSVLVIPFAFFAVSFSYTFMFISLILMVNIFVEIVFKLNKKLIIGFSISIFISIILLLALYQKIKMPYALLLLNTSNILIFSIYFIYNLFGAKK